MISIPLVGFVICIVVAVITITTLIILVNASQKESSRAKKRAQTYEQEAIDFSVKYAGAHSQANYWEDLYRSTTVQNVTKSTQTPEQTPPPTRTYLNDVGVLGSV